MDNAMMIELFGYLGSLLVVISMLMTSVMKLRIINTIGAGIFSLYALIIQSYPTALMNTCLVLINIYNLIRLSRKERHYDLIEGKEGEPLLHYLLHYYREDIIKYFPGFPQEVTGADIVCIVCADAVPAGILLGKMRNGDAVEIILDYSTPAYRDCSVGAYLYPRLSEKGIRRLVYTGKEKKHISYLKNAGFMPENENYVKLL